MNDAVLSESYLIGALLTDHDAVFPVLRSAGITEESFSVERCARAWATMERMRAAGSPIEMAAVAQSYGDDPDDSMTVLEPMLKDCLTTTHAEYHAGLVREAQRRRDFATALKTAQERLARGDAPEDVCRDLGDVLEAAERQSAGGPLVATFPPIRFNDLKAYDPKTEENHILGKGMLRRGSWTLLTGGTGIGKSVLVEQIAACLACGKSIFGLNVLRPFTVLLLTAENDEEVLKQDLEAIAAHENLDAELLDRNLQIHHAFALDGQELVTAIDGELRRGGFDLFILDNYQAYSGDDINGSKEWKLFISPFVVMLKKWRAAMLLVDHTGKPQERKGWGKNDSVYIGGGTSRKANGARASMELYSPDEGDERYRLHFGKNWKRAGVVDELGNRVRDVYLDHSPSADAPSWTPSADQTDHKPMVEGEQEIVDHATAHPFDSLRKIEAATGYSKSKVQRVLAKHPLLSHGREENS